VTIADFIVNIKGNTDDLNKKINATNQQFNKLEDAAKKAKKDGTEPLLSSLSTRFAQLASKSGPIGIAIAAVGAFAYGLFQIGKAGNEYVKIENAFNKISAAAGASGHEIVTSLQAASAGAVSTEDIMKSSSNAIKLLGSEAIAELPKLMKIAVASAAASGESVTKTFNDIIVATGRQSIEILDNVGISAVTTRKYMDEYAKSQGKTTTQLDAAGKKAAFFYAATKAGNEILEAQGGKVENLVDGFDKLNTSSANFANQFSKSFAPGMSEVSKAISELIDNFTYLMRLSSDDEKTGLEIKADRAINVWKFAAPKALKDLVTISKEQYNTLNQYDKKYYDNMLARRKDLDDFNKKTTSNNKKETKEKSDSDVAADKAWWDKKLSLHNKYYSDSQKARVNYYRELASIETDPKKGEELFNKATDIELQVLKDAHKAQLAEAKQYRVDNTKLKETQDMELDIFNRKQLSDSKRYLEEVYQQNHEYKLKVASDNVSFSKTGDFIGMASLNGSKEGPMFSVLSNNAKQVLDAYAAQWKVFRLTEKEEIFKSYGELAEQVSNYGISMRVNATEVMENISVALVERLNISIETVREKLNDFRNMSIGLASEFGQGLAQSMVTFFDAMAAGDLKLKDIGKAMKDFILQFMSMIEVQVLGKYAASIAMSLMDAFFTGGASLAQIPASLAALAGFTATFEGLKAGIRAMATGGIVTGPTNALIGEAGPEAVLPLNDRTFAALARGITGQIGVSGNLSSESNRTINLVLDGKVISQHVDNYRDNKAFNMGAKNYSFASAY